LRRRSSKRASNACVPPQHICVEMRQRLTVPSFRDVKLVSFSPPTRVT
jgi:hypothetical protein